MARTTTLKGLLAGFEVRQYDFTRNGERIAGTKHVLWVSERPNAAPEEVKVPELVLRDAAEAGWGAAVELVCTIFARGDKVTLTVRDDQAGDAKFKAAAPVRAAG